MCGKPFVYDPDEILYRVTKMNQKSIHRRDFLLGTAGIGIAGSFGASVLTNLCARQEESGILQHPVTIKGAVACNRTTEKTQWHQCCNSVNIRHAYCYNPIRCTTAKEMGIPEEQFCNSGDHTPVVYAVEGTPEIESELAKLVDEFFPAGGMNADQAQTFLDAYGARLKYALTGNYGILRDIHNAVERTSLFMTLTGKPYRINGKLFFEVTDFINPGQETADIPNFPSRMTEPDKPIVSVTGQPLTLTITEGLTLKCVCIPSGSFLQGSAFYERRYQDEYPHKVTLTSPYFMSEIPVTQEMFEAVMGHNSSVHVGKQYPVQNVLYRDILRFLEILSERNGREICLPTDAQWEYAARVGTSNPCFVTKYRDQISGNLKSAANADNAWALHDPKPVKSHSPNAWGLYDLFGHGWHLMSDYKDVNPRVETIDPKGPPLGTKTIQTNRFGPMHRTKGGFYYNIARPPMHGAAGEDGTLWESGAVIFRIVAK